MTEAVVQSVLSMKLSKEKISRYEEIRNKILEVPKFGNDIPEVDVFCKRCCLYIYKTYPAV